MEEHADDASAEDFAGICRDQGTLRLVAVNADNRVGIGFAAGVVAAAAARGQDEGSNRGCADGLGSTRETHSASYALCEVVTRPEGPDRPRHNVTRATLMNAEQRNAQVVLITIKMKIVRKN
ncbi:hypothetical protein [Acaricomes phytoseiuli]|uniref:hypothetical protein n=1 Tax=Acaricomes phytoseiuli TaxID=291968 RepID=UPI00316AD849